jgi:hypothetical protein
MEELLLAVAGLLVLGIFNSVSKKLAEGNIFFDILAWIFKFCVAGFFIWFLYLLFRFIYKFIL